MAEPEMLTAERRAEIEAVMWRMIATAERAGIAALTAPATTALRDCLAEIDRLTAALATSRAECERYRAALIAIADNARVETEDQEAAMAREALKEGCR